MSRLFPRCVRCLWLMTAPWALWALWALWVLWAGVGGSAAAATLRDESVATPDGSRPYVLALPEGGLPAGAPLVVLLHGHGGNATNTVGRGPWRSPLSAWLAVADREHLAVAALQGSLARDGTPGWNDCRGDTPDPPDTDDVAYVEAVIHQLRAQRAIDPRRVYVMGMSNGAMMALRLAQEMAPAPAGVVAVAGLMAARSECKAPTRPIPVMLIAGTADPLVPYTGGDLRIGPLRRGELLSVDATAATWRAVNGQPDIAETQLYAHRHGADDPTRATRILWRSNAAAAPVAVIRIEGGGHAVPSLAPQTRSTPRSGRLGPQNLDIESAEEAWAFFLLTPAHR